jgi:hypothetical protein
MARKPSLTIFSKVIAPNVRDYAKSPKAIWVKVQSIEAFYLLLGDGQTKHFRYSTSLNHQIPGNSLYLTSFV